MGYYPAGSPCDPGIDLEQPPWSADAVAGAWEEAARRPPATAAIVSADRAMIRLENLSVCFVHEGRRLEAVNGVSLAVPEGEVYGIVGASGAGKSTLLRAVNRLQQPTGGRVFVAGEDITVLQGAALRRVRLKIGMIFQHFNLIRNKTVAGNVAFALNVAGKSRAEIDRRVPELLELVGLADKATAYPARLSGGQKQRVGIARALANEPRILLCDEPTSALDLETTAGILDLLKAINRRLKITMLLISHEMAVIKRVCDQVAVMSGGEVVEAGAVYEIFAAPRHAVTRQLVAHTHDLRLPERVAAARRGALLRVVYRGDRAEEPVLSDAAKRFAIDLNIRHGAIEYIGDQPLGVLLLEANGARAEVRRAVVYLRERVASVEVVDD